MMQIENWELTKERFIAWWKHSKIDRPMLRIVAKRRNLEEKPENILRPETPEEYYLDVAWRVKKHRNYFKTHVMMAEAYPSMDQDIGPGSMAAYLGSEPIFSWETVWFKECVKAGWDKWGPLKFDSDNYWWKRHLELVEYARKLSEDEFLVNVPDIIENIDILSAMRGPQELCYDLMDEPERIKDYLGIIDDLYFEYYDKMYEIVKGDDGSSSYSAFKIWGPGKTAAIQCDFSAMLSPGQFNEFIVPSLQKQCWRLDNSLYHLDGLNATIHLDSLMKIEELDALQWTPDAGEPDSGNEKWFPIYDKVKNANKSLWIDFRDGGVDNWIESADKLIKRYGSNGIYLLFPEMSEDEGLKLLRKAEKSWK